MFLIYAKVFMDSENSYTDVVKKIIANSKEEAKALFSKTVYGKHSIYNVVKL